MDRPKSVLRVIRGVAQIIHVSRSSCGMYGIRYLRVFDYVSVSSCATGPARESEVYPLRPQMARGKKTNTPITPIQPLSGDSAPLGVINTAATRGGNESHSRGGGGQVHKDTFPFKKTSKNPEGD